LDFGHSEVVRAERADHESLRLQNEFFEKATQPLDTSH
jgi:hypothetical protein